MPPIDNAQPIFPVISHEIKMVSRVPVTRQVMAFKTLLLFRSIYTYKLLTICIPDTGMT